MASCPSCAVDYEPAYPDEEYCWRCEFWRMYNLHAMRGDLHDDWELGYLNHGGLDEYWGCVHPVEIDDIPF